MTAEYLIVPNWSDFQHYKDRDPPWIKLHRRLLTDYEFCQLPDASKSHLMLIWLFASQRDGRVPNDPVFLKDKLGLKELPDLDLLVECGFLCKQTASKSIAGSKRIASNVLAARKQLAMPEAEAEAQQQKQQQQPPVKETTSDVPAVGNGRGLQ